MHEVGIVEHSGNRFAANGATCDGRHLAAYVQDYGDAVTLKTWKGAELMSLRCVRGEEFTLNEFGDTGEVLLLRCGRRRWIGGLSLGSGMLFRGETILDEEEVDALHLANVIGHAIAELDCEDEE